MKIIEPKSDLSPFISLKTLQIHFNQHHMKYVKNIESLLIENGENNKDLLYLIKKYPKLEYPKIYNNAAQILNHNLFWESMKLNTYETNEKTIDYLEKTINFKTKFREKSNNMFGSGWVFLIKKDDKLDIITTKDGDYPEDCLIILALDLWEHAYYLDYQGNRTEFINIFIENLINWDRVRDLLI